MGARDENFKSPPPGFLLHAYSIRWAIRNGFKIYDFLQGNESYKYMFGARDRPVGFTLISTKNRKNIGDVLEQHSISYVLQESMKLHKDGKIAQAERGLRQIVEAAPAHPKAGYLLAQLLSKNGAYKEAGTVIKTFLDAHPRDHNAWFTLAGILAAQGETGAAGDACRKVLALHPGHQEAAHLLSTLSPANDRLRALLGREIAGL